MTKEFVKYEQALALKELGFDEPCLKMGMSDIDIINTERTDEGDYPKNSHLFSGWVAIPTYSQAFRWFREKHNLCGEVYTVNMGAIDYTFQIRDLYSEDLIHDNFEASTASYSGTFSTYEEAESACLDKLIQIVKNNAHI